MYELLQAHIARYVSLPAREQQVFFDALQYKQYRRHQYLLQEGDICKHDYFVVEGGLRQYEVDQAAREKTIHFGFENWWISDRYSLLTGTPSIYNIQALEKTTVLYIHKDTLEKLFLEIPRLERYFHIVLQHAFAVWQGRILMLQKPAEEKYQEFLQHYGAIEQRLSLQHIASYLGITRETLSRIRSQAARK
jgi:CRP-like cAMP-binding protein